MTVDNYDSYDKIIINFSGGKDSTACVLYFLACGVPKEKIQLWHQCIDGYGIYKRSFFDWPGTESYVKRFADTLGLWLGFQWRDFGFYGELHRENAFTNQVSYLHDDNIVHLPTKSGKRSTRLKFPAKSADLNVRWCSAYLKIDVAARVLNNDPTYKGTTIPKRILFVTGERREESPNRANYKKAELHRCNSKKRIVHHYRPVIDLSEVAVWDIIKNFGINPHPAYYLGFPRLSCMSCIFYSKDHWATLSDVNPESIQTIGEMEKQFNHTIDNKYDIWSMVMLGDSKYDNSLLEYARQAMNPDYPIQIQNTYKNWKMPAGAFGSGGGSI